MAAPPEKTIRDLSGKWTMNKTLSDDSDRLLQMQGVSWFMRRAIAIANVSLTVEQYEKDGQTHIDATQVATGGVTSTENRTLDWTLRDHTDKVFGKVKGKSRWVKLSDVDDDDYLKTGFDDMEGEHVQAWIEDKGGEWTANQVSRDTSPLW
ncbi:MAG: hypothetical protein Q9219_000243 [cf. Caloplaca sp. 3 TL-2023]